MKNVRVVGCLFLAAAVAAGALQLTTAEGNQKKEKKRIATTKQLMKGIVGPNCGALGKALKADSADWDEIALRTALLNEAGHVLMADGRCPDGEWAKAAKAIQQNSKELDAAVKDKNLEAAKKAFGALTKGGCAVCHKAHKGKKKS